MNEVSLSSQPIEGKHPLSEENSKNKLANLFMIEEWKSLREEIGRKQSFMERIFISLVGANIAIYSFALQKSDAIHSIMCGMTIVLTTIAYYLVLHHRFSADRIAVYLRSQFEKGYPELGLNWETWKEELNKSEVMKRAILDKWQFVYYFNLAISLVIWFAHFLFIEEKCVYKFSIENPFVGLGAILAYGLIMHFFVIERYEERIRQIRKAADSIDNKESSDVGTELTRRA